MAIDSGGAIGNWLMTPVVSAQDGVTLDFKLPLLGAGLLGTVQVLVSTGSASTSVTSMATSTRDASLLATFSSSTDTGWLLKRAARSRIGGPVQG